MTNCPCGTQKSYDACCGLFISGKQKASSPETLMRSRYTAYTKANIDYIQNTMRPPASNEFNPIEAYQWARRVQWKKLDVLRVSPFDTKGWVEFIAYFIEEDQPQQIHETSEFHFIDNTWFYVNGK